MATLLQRIVNMDLNPVEQLYDSDPQREWAREDRHRTEFAVTRRVLADYLPPPPATIADLGGGPGRYAIPLAQQGYQVTLVDLSQENLALAQNKAAEAGTELAAVVHANVLSLPDLPEFKYDAVLLMGPLYHLLEQAERETAVAIAYKLLKPGGLIFAAFITRFAPFRDMAGKGHTSWISDHAERAQQILETGKNKAHPGNSFPDSYFAHPDEIKPLMEGADFETAALVGCEGIVAGHEEHINQLDGKLWKQWLDLNYRFSHEPSLYGASDHLLYIGQKGQ
jgi:2-polyprenyl-3-methyl-5-hydroxy-6-metoxy-1,4-benzoquinol methylase